MREFLATPFMFVVNINLWISALILNKDFALIMVDNLEDIDIEEGDE